MLPRDAPSTAPREMQGEAFAMAGSIGRSRRGWLLPICPTCLRVSLLQHRSNVLAGRVGGVELPLPGEMSHLSGFPLHTFLPRVTSPAGCFWHSSSTCLMGDGVIALSLQHCRVASGRSWTGAARERCRVGLACTLLQLAWAGSPHAFLNPLPSGVPDPTSNPGRCLQSRQELRSSRQPLPGMWAAPEQGSPGISISVCSHPSRAA